MTSDETIARIETIWWVTHTALLSYSRYKKTLNNKVVFSVVFPDVSFENPKITHTIGESIDFMTTKNELLAPENSNLFTGWQIILGIVGMTSVFDLFLKSIADKVTGSNNKSLGIFDNFDKLTGINLKKQLFFKELRKYHAVRDISLHNLGIINQKFIDKTNSAGFGEGAYVYYPADLSRYKTLLEGAVDFINKSSDKI